MRSPIAMATVSNTLDAADHNTRPGERQPRAILGLHRRCTMPIGLGLGSSHPTYVIMKQPEDWISAYQRVALHTPQPPEAALETTEVIQGYIDRIDHSFAVLRQQ